MIPSLLRQEAPQERVLVISPHSSYRTTAFLDAANRLGVEVLFASEGKYSVVSAHADGLHIDLRDTKGALRTILHEAKRCPFAGIVGTDDPTTELAARAAWILGLPHNPWAAVKIARRKDMARARLIEKGVPVPRHRLINLRQSLTRQCDRVRFPCVLKPLTLSASRGVIRADNLDQFLQACARIDRLLHSEGAEERDHILAEDFIPGAEVAVEAMLTAGRLDVLAIFDKPDPLNGPFFEETYYITPSQLDAVVQDQIRQCVNDACRAYGLREGPIHAECRLNNDGIWIIEVAARTIGGLCARLLRFGTGYSLEDLVLSHAMAQPLQRSMNREGAAGVLMIPTPQAGILRRVEGTLAAQKVPFVEEVSVLVREGYRLVPWPEGSSYLGFIFAHASTPEQAESALRQAHSELNFVVAPLWNLDNQSNHVTTAMT